VTYSLAIGACTQEETKTITVAPDADADWAVPAELCAGESAELMTSGTPGGQWTGEGVVDHGDGTATFSTKQAGSFAITYRVGSGECVSELTQVIEVFSVPDATWFPPGAPGCPGEQILLTPSGAPGGIWSGAGVVDLGDGTAIFSQDEAGTYANHQLCGSVMDLTRGNMHRY
jgi:hypothetical protein